jgi:uncharacterized repeat protein (TIGR01451 family)
LAVEKIANTFVAEIGDAVRYAVRVRNVGGPTLPEASVTDRLPLGFRYIAGSARWRQRRARSRCRIRPGARASPDVCDPAQAESDEVLITIGARRARRAAG